MLRFITRATVGCVSVVLLIFAPIASAQFFKLPKVAIQEDFSDPSHLADRWQALQGNWSESGGTYGNTAAATSIAAIRMYPPFYPSDPPSSVLRYDVFNYRVRMRNPGTTASDLVGLIYNYQDSSNYYALYFSPTGVAYVARVTDGITVSLQEAPYEGGGTNVWFDVEVRRDENRFLSWVLVNGVPVFTDVWQPELMDGLLGLISHNVAGRFDKVALEYQYGISDPYREPFDTVFGAAWFAPPWTVANGAYNNNVVNKTSVSLLPQPNQGALEPEPPVASYTFRARMFNPYGAKGNLVGLVFDYVNSRDYAEVVFSPTGVAQLRRQSGDTTQVLATANYAGTRNKWFDVKFEHKFANVVSANVDGHAVFRDVSLGNKTAGDYGLITHWTPGSFDDVWFDRGVVPPLSVSFDSSLPSPWVRSGQWDTHGGTLNGTAVGETDVAATRCACWSTDFRLSARLLNEFDAKGNLVGLVFNYQTSGFYAGDYYEVVFSPTGIAQLNRVIEGGRYTVARAAHTVPRNTWFKVEVLRGSGKTTVLVGGQPVFQDVPENELGAGDVGAITHWTRGSFDDLKVQDYVVR
jgi:hypothetical protein